MGGVGSERLWAFWRIRYIEAVKKGRRGCFFCDSPREGDDEKNLILHRGERTFTILNRFPYNPGHLLVAPYRHMKEIDQLSKEELSELFDMVAFSLRVVKVALNPDGVNVGINIGRVAGAGEEHLHVHVVPRWEGDTSFMPLLADVKVVPEALQDTFAKLKEGLRKLQAEG